MKLIEKFIYEILVLNPQASRTPIQKAWLLMESHKHLQFLQPVLIFEV